MSISQNFPAISPTLNLNFARSKKLDPRITFTRTSSATRTNAQGLIEVVSANTPRFDHSYNSSSGSVNSLGLLVEEARTNLVTYSGTFSATWGINSSAVITYNSSTSPDGTTNATQIAAAASIGSGVFRTFSLTSGTAYTYSLFVKAVSGSNTIYFGTDLGTDATVQVNTSTGVATSNSGGGALTNITSTSYPNGWYRISFTFTASVTATHSFVIYNLTANANTWLAYGAQVEAGAFPTSYIPTVASSVTRSTDNASMTGTNFTSWYNSTEGSVFVNYKGKSQEGTSYERVYSINLNSTFNVEEILLVNNIGYNPDRIGYIVYDNSVAIQDTTGTTGGYVVASSNSVKTAMCYKTADYAYVFNGQTPITENAAGVPTVNTLDIGRVADAGRYNGTISQLSYYPRRLTNSQLQNLTK